MDKGEVVSFDRDHHDCTTGYTAIVHEGTTRLGTANTAAINIPVYTDEAAEKIKSGDCVLPQNTVVGIGAAPLLDVPENVKIDWIAVVCNPHWANFIGGARTVIDGYKRACGHPSTAILCNTMHDDNVVITPIV